MAITQTQPIYVTVPMGQKGLKGDKGDPGTNGTSAQWESMTQDEYDALVLAGTLDPNTLYVIIP